MSDAPQTTVTAPTSTATGTSTTPSNGHGGIIARGEQAATEAVAAALADLGFAPRAVDFRPLPFEGTWGLATSAAYGLANEAVTRELEASGQLVGLSKK